MIEPEFLMDVNETNPDTGFLCHYVKSDTEYFGLHTHNYYELFLTLDGNITHIINGSTHHLHKNQLLFVRDTDVHTYKSADGKYFEFINLAFSKEHLHQTFAFLGDGFPPGGLFSAKIPPHIDLTESRAQKLTYDFVELTDPDPDVAKMKLRILLLNIFTQYFSAHAEAPTEIPFWLELTCEKMKNPKNFTAGLSRMYEISGKSREHLARYLHTYYNTTPVNFINELRLDYAAKLLITSNLSATEICFECGFESLSWFYKIFSKRFSVSPSIYRKQNKINP